MSAAGLMLKISVSDPVEQAALKNQLFDWYQRILKMPKGSEFFRTVEEWKKLSFAHLADALFVIVTYFFSTLFNSYVVAERDGKSYQGRITPRNIGRRKDFWNRLDMAYNDLQMQGVLRKVKANNKFGYQDIIDRYFDQWENRYDDLLSSDPCSFPGFRLSIENALNNDLPPCGVVTGIGTLKETSEGAIANPRVGVVISNVQFQAGAFDMASAE
jgi:hypothetical protein